MIHRLVPPILLVAALAAPAATGAPSPYVAVYAVSYGSLSVGDSRVELRRDAAPGCWVLESRSSAHGLARLVVSDELVQNSRLEIDGLRVRPLRYRFDAGGDAGKSVSLDFDWTAHQVTGTAEGQPVSVGIPDGLQDSLSLQLSAALELQAGRQLESLAMIEKDSVKQYRYVLEGHQPLDTPLGRIDTVVYRSERPNNKRWSRLWYAPSLGYINVRAEQYREHKKLFSLQIKSFKGEGSDPR